MRVRTRAWISDVATRRNEDGTVSLVTIDPQTLGLSFVIGERDGTPTLTTRDGQHVYEFVAATAASSAQCRRRKSRPQRRR